MSAQPSQQERCVGGLNMDQRYANRPAKEAFSPDLRQIFADARTRLAEAGLRRLL